MKTVDWKVLCKNCFDCNLYMCIQGHTQIRQVFGLLIYCSMDNPIKTTRCTIEKLHNMYFDVVN